MALRATQLLEFTDCVTKFELHSLCRLYCKYGLQNHSHECHIFNTFPGLGIFGTDNKIEPFNITKLGFMGRCQAGY